jgi:hypothetical protein
MPGTLRRRDERLEPQPGESGRPVQRVDRGDPAIGDGEREDRDRLAGLGGDKAAHAVDHRRVRHAVGRGELGASRHLPSAGDACERAAAVVGMEHDVGVEHGQETLEVAAARGGQERVDDLAVGGGRIAVGALDAAARP